jgi:hypothetical protein
MLSIMPAVTPGSSSPISTSGWTNLADVEFLDISFTGNAGAWTTRIYHYRPTTPVIPGGHVVFQDGGHAVSSEWASYGDAAVIQQLIAAGYGVAVTQQPLEGLQDPGYSGSPQLHDSFWSAYSDTQNPLERWHGPNAIAMNYLQHLYVKRSICGLSGGGYRAAHYMALDPRVNHACVAIRGTIADRRYVGEGIDFEQRPKSNGWKAEEFYKLAAERNRRVVFVYHPNDDCCFDQFADATGRPAGAYIDAVDYDQQFLAPIRAAFPRADVKIYIDQGIANHSNTQDMIDNALMPALRTPLASLHRPRPGLRLGLRAA